jgi:hypothetical protein
MLALTGRARASGSESHRSVAEVAEQALEPATAYQVRELLALENATTLAEVSTWAHDVRPQRLETAWYHFVDIPIRPPAGTPAAYVKPNAITRLATASSRRSNALRLCWPTRAHRHASAWGRSR